MILQALVSYYETLAARGELPQPGWAPVKVSYVLNLDDQGDITTVICIKEEVTRKKKKGLVPQIIQLPAIPRRSGKSISSYFLYDNSKYILGVDKTDPPERSLECFQATKSFYEKLLATVEHPAAHALLAFFAHWEPEKMLEHPAFAHQDINDILGSSNLIFRYRGQFLHEIPAIRQVWQEYYNNNDQSGEVFPCLITGQIGPVARLHPSIKGIPGAQSSGASLVSFNAPAFCSYDREQGLNAPTSQYAAFAYGAALNHLIATQNTRVGDVTLLFWAESGEDAYADALKQFSFEDEDDKYKEKDLKGLMDSLAEGADVEWDGTRIDPNMTFYILGISPNAARLSVRFFLRNSFGQFIRNVKAHYDRLEIVRPSFDPFDNIPVWRMLKETVNPNSREKKPAADMAGDTLRAILTNMPYPATLLNGVTLRIRADREMNRTRAAILKAYYLKNRNPFVPEEVLTVSLNPDCNDKAYVLGRLFSVLETIQSAANPGIKATIRDRYFNSASATPSVVFPTLVNLALKHLGKLEEKTAHFYEQQMEELMDRLGVAFPDRMNRSQQGAFQLGYYQQRRYHFTKKEDK